MFKVANVRFQSKLCVGILFFNDIISSLTTTNTKCDLNDLKELKGQQS